ncbi:hypothetical protein [Ruminococcus sp.]|uniref:hypothetical protein n=1 Tax=Ruminococcus sp. TaxID=41978 RepID=UPI00386C84AB
MNKSAQPNRKTGRMIMKNLIVLLTLAVVCFVGIYSWFSTKSTAKASGLSVSCQAPDGVEIAAVEHGKTPLASDYKTKLVLDETGFLAKLDMRELTSDGVTFYSPKLTQVNGVAVPDEDDKWTLANPGVDYLCFDLYMRMQNPRKIYITADSSLSPLDEELTWTGESTKSNNPSTYGNFSKDCMIGATRFSIFDSDNNSKVKWITRPDIYLNQDDTNYSVLTGLTDNSYGTYTHNYWKVTENGNTQTKIKSTDADFVASTVTNSTVQLGVKKEIANLSGAQKSDDGYYYTHVVVNLWVEGEDAEARLALSGGKFKLNFNLDGDLVS